MRSSTKANATLMFQTDSAQGLASPMPPLRGGTGRTASTSAPGRRFERHPSARVRTGIPYLSMARRSSVATDTTGTDASGPSFTTTSTYIAATTAPPPSASDTEGAEEETDGAARSDAFAEASLADELAADESGAAVEP